MALKDITLGQYFPGDTPIHRLDPRTKIDEAQVVVNNGRALIAVRFDAQYSAGLDDRMKQQITETVQKVDDNIKDVEITDDDTLYGQIKGLGERVANVTGLDELADDFGDLWDRIIGR